MRDTASRAAEGRENPENLEGALGSIAEKAFVPKGDIRKALIEGWEEAVDRLLDDGILNPSEESALATFKNHFALSQDELDNRGALSRVAKAGILRDLMDGKVPQRVDVDGRLPFNFQKSEQLIYLFANVEYLEDKTRTQYVGGYQGASVRIMKGVYYRVGGFKGTAVQSTERVHVDPGTMAVTTKHIYFSGPKKSFRIRFDKIVTFTPFSDAVAIVRDALTAKPQIFITGDGWFTYNLLTNVSQLFAAV